MTDDDIFGLKPPKAVSLSFAARIFGSKCESDEYTRPMHRQV